MMAVAFTAEEVARMKELRGQGISSGAIAEKLASEGYPPRSHQAVSVKLSKLRVPSTVRVWTKAEDAVLARGVKGGVPVAGIVVMLARAGFWRTLPAVNSRVCGLYPDARGNGSDGDGVPDRAIQDLAFKAAVIVAHPNIPIGVFKDHRPLTSCTEIRNLRAPIFSPEGSHF